MDGKLIVKQCICSTKCWIYTFWTLVSVFHIFFFCCCLEWIALKQRRFISISKANTSVACGWMPLAAGKHIPFEPSAHCEFRVEVIVYSIEVKGQIKKHRFSLAHRLLAAKSRMPCNFVVTCVYKLGLVHWYPLNRIPDAHTRNPSQIQSISSVRLMIVFSERFIYWLFGDKICHTRNKSTEYSESNVRISVYIIVCRMSMQSITCAHINNKQHNTPQSTLAID